MMRVLRCCHERNIVALPVFDCVVFKASAEAAVREIMQREFKAVAGLSIPVKRELSEPVDDNERTGVRRVLLQLLHGRVEAVKWSGL